MLRRFNSGFQRERPSCRRKALKLVPIILNLVLPLLVLSAADPSAADKNAKLIRSLTDSLAAAPPEIEADCFLRIADSGKASAAVAKDLVERAFWLASSAAQSVPRVTAVSAARWLGDSDPAIISSAGRQQVDALTLRCRAVDSMLRLSVPQAREMFDQIRIEVPATNCADALRPNVDAYYKTMFEVFKRAFDAGEREKGVDVEWFSAHARVKSAVEIAPIIKAILEFRTDETRLVPLSGRLASDIGNVRPDDRSFTATLSEAGTAVQELGNALRGLKASLHPLMDAWAGYLKRGLTAPRCPESMVEDGLKLAKDSVEAYNAAGTAGDTPLSKIDLNEMSPKEVLAAHAEVQRYWASAENQKMKDDYRVLRFGNADQQAAYASTKRADHLLPFLPLEERRSPEWIAHARDYLRELENWTQGLGETGLMHFAMITEMYSEVLEIIPSDSPLFRAVLDSYIQLLRNSRLKADNPAVWLLRLGALINRGFSGAQESDLASIRALIKQRGESTMGALVDLRELTGR
ncbi:MAG: hypothetical protein ACR2NN_21250 [Bryobacteraceae bacterium]